MNTERLSELRSAMQKNARWDALANFLDTIDTIEDLEAASTEILVGSPTIGNENLIMHYRETLSRWPTPELPIGFAEKCPLIAKRLDAPHKIRIFLRGADFRGVDPLLMGEVFEDLVYKHEVLGQKTITDGRGRDGTVWGQALRVVYHTQLQAWALTHLLLPDVQSCGTNGEGLVTIDWRTKEERELAS